MKKRILGILAGVIGTALAVLCWKWLLRQRLASRSADVRVTLEARETIAYYARLAEGII